MSYEFWTHGVNTFVQYPKRTLQTAEPNLGIEHTGSGTRIKQNSSDNWLHIPVPTPTILAGNARVFLHFARVVVTLNKNAELTQVQLLVNKNSVFTSHHSISDDFIQVDADNPNAIEVNGGLVVTVFVKFKPGTPTGEIFVHGACANFNTLPL